MSTTKYCIEILEIGVWISVDTAESFQDACTLAAMYAQNHSEDKVQITGGAAINEP